MSEHVLMFVGEGILHLFVQMMWSEKNITLENMRPVYEKGEIKCQTENPKLQVIWYSSSMQDLKEETSGNT